MKNKLYLSILIGILSTTYAQPMSFESLWIAFGDNKAWVGASLFSLYMAQRIVKSFHTFPNQEAATVYWKSRVKSYEDKLQLWKKFGVKNAEQFYQNKKTCRMIDFFLCTACLIGVAVYKNYSQ